MSIVRRARTLRGISNAVAHRHCIGIPIGIRALHVLLLLLIPCFGFCDAPLDRFEQIIEPSVTSNRFMGAVLVAKDGAPLLDKGYGYANLEWQIPNTPTTKFRLGSLTKQFTAAAILLLEERGKLKLDDPVKRYLPDAPAAWDKITIFNLLTHTSGLPSFTEFSEKEGQNTIPTTPQQLVARFRYKPLDFKPGEGWHYSNSGYVLLGCLIETISGQHYADFLRENIFAPLGMHDSGYDSNESIIPRRAQGYSPGKEEPQNAGYVHMSVPFSAGGLYSTTHDLLLWEDGLFGGKVLSAASLKEMTSPFKENYALGVFVGEHQGHKVVYHDGDIEGFDTYMAYYPADKVVVVVLGNVQSRAISGIGAKLGIVANGGKIVPTSERKAVSVPRSVLEKYVGTYALAPTFKLHFFLDGDQLMTQATGQAAIAVFAESETEFFLKEVDASITFVKNASGDVMSVVLHQNGRDVPGKREQHLF